jgi:hypothetical protein
MEEKMKKVTAIILAVTLCGCTAQPPQETFGPDGKPATKIECQGVPNDFTGCYAKAGDICGAKGYHVVEKANGISLNSVLVECK